MKKKTPASPRTTTLRGRAETKLKKRKKEDRPAAETDLRKLNHELQVHQVELEMQIEELRRAQQELEASRNKYVDLYNDLYDFAPVGYFILDQQGTILEANLTSAVMLGNERGLLLKKPFSQFVAPDNQDLFRQYQRQVFSNAEKKTCEIKLITKDGKEFFGYFNSIALKHKEADRSCRVAVIDITERKKAEEALRESEEKYRNLVERASDGIIIVQDAIVKFANQRMAELDGSSVEQLVGTPFTDHVHPDELPRLMENYRRRMAGENVSATYEAVLIRRDGSPAPSELSAGVIIYQGRPANLIMIRDITARKQAEEALREAEIRYRLLFEHSPDGIVIIDPATTQLLEFNETAHRQLGYSREEFARLSISDFEDVEAPEETRARIAKVTREGRNDFETRHRTRQGEIRNIHVTAQFTELLGRPVYHCVWRDITQRKQAEESLQEIEELFRSVMEKANDAIFIIDGSGNIIFWNKKSEELYGYTADEMIGKSNGMLIPERFRARHETLRQRVRAGEVSLSGGIKEGVSIRKDGSEFYVASSIALLRQGGEQHLVVINRDISERMQVEAALNKVNKAYRALSTCNRAVARAVDEIELLREAVRIVQEDCGYRFVWIGLAMHDEGKSIQAVAQSGYEDGYLDSARITWADTERGRGPTGTAMRTGQPVIIKDVRTDPAFAPWRDEALKRGYLSAAAVSLRSGRERLGALTAYADTPGAFTDEEMSLLQELADNLAYGISSLRSDKARQQLESQLLQTQKMEAIGTLAGGIAHDFNNILAAIMGNAEMALQILPEYSTAYKHLEQILKSSERARNLVKQILAFSRKSTEDRAPMEIKRAVMEVIKMLKSTLPATIEIRENITSDGWIMGSVIQMHQVLLNLCTNAFHAMRETGGILTIDLSDANIEAGNIYLNHDLLPGDYVKLSVIDTGTGIAPEIKNRIFDPFFTTKGIGEGTGMGLSVVYGIVKSHGGDITVESEPGKGTTFHILLPRIAGKAAEKEQEKHPVPTGTERILLVDDEEIIVDVGQKILEMLGYRVTVAHNAAEALEIFQKEPDVFDLVITDYTMPKMSGYELAQKLMEVRPDMPIIMNTGYNETISQEKALAAGIREFLLKPLNLKKLGEVVRKVLDKGKEATGNRHKGKSVKR